jgi:hypothetical protein
MLMDIRRIENAARMAMASPPHWDEGGGGATSSIARWIGIGLCGVAVATVAALFMIV